MPTLLDMSRLQVMELKPDSLTDRDSDLGDTIGKTVENSHQSMSRYALCDTPKVAQGRRGRGESDGLLLASRHR